MILTSEQAEQRLSSPQNLANRFGNPSVARTVTLKQPGRKEGIPNIDVEIREHIALRARCGERQKKIAKEHGTTQARVSQLERGQDKSIDEEKIETDLSIVRDKAAQNLMLILGLITPAKLQKLNVKELGGMAARMSTVVKNVTPEEKAQQNIQVVVYSPELRKEENYKSIDV